MVKNAERKEFTSEQRWALAENAARNSRRNRLYLLAALVSGLLGLLVWLFRSMWGAGDIYVTANRFIPNRLLPIITLILLLASLTTFVVLYLQTGFKRYSVEDYLPHVAMPNSESPVATDILPTESAATSIVEGIRALSGEHRSSSQDSDVRIIDVTRHTEDLIGRLSRAIELQGRRNNINLGFGFFITLVGISILVYFVQQYHDIDPTKPWSILNFIPRLSLVILVELFAYFFLNLYRNGLAEVKYLQNEVTNVRLRTLGLRVAICENDKESAGHIMRAFGDTDRNVSSHIATAAPEPAELLKTAQLAIKLAGKFTGPHPEHHSEHNE